VAAGLGGGEAEGGGGARKKTTGRVASGAWERIGRREKEGWMGKR
jgi:hypothetical protein